MKLNLGKTPEEQAAEEAQKQRERELEIQKANLERQQKIESLRTKQKVNKIIIIGVSGALAAVLLVFGTFNTFFKKNLTITDVQNQIYNQVNAYPGEGLDNYIRDISQTLFNEHVGYDANKYVSAIIDKNSVYISRVKKTNNIFSQVYFMADVVLTEKDSKVTDPNVLAILKKGGLQTPSPSTYSSQSSTTYSSSSSMSSTSSIDDIDDIEDIDAFLAALNESNTSSSGLTSSSDLTSSTDGNTSSNNDNNTLSTESTESRPVESTSSSSGTSNTPEADPNTVGDVTLGSGIDATEYYLLSNGTYMQKGKATTYRYTFMVPVEYYYNTDDQGRAISSGYRTAGKLSLYSLYEVDVFAETETIHSYYAFNPETAVDEVTYASARQTIDKIFSDIYAGTVLPQDFVNARKFNTYGATYVSLDEFEFYTATNPFGYNAMATYTIKLKQGFLYTTTVYLVVEPNNTTWKITAMS